MIIIIDNDDHNCQNMTIMTTMEMEMMMVVITTMTVIMTTTMITVVTYVHHNHIRVVFNLMSVESNSRFALVLLYFTL